MTEDSKDTRQKRWKRQHIKVWSKLQARWCS